MKREDCDRHVVDELIKRRVEIVARALRRAEVLRYIENRIAEESTGDAEESVEKPNNGGNGGQ